MKVDPKRLFGLLFASNEQGLRALAPSSDDAWRALHETCKPLGAAGLLHAALRRNRCAALAPSDVRDAVRLAHATNAAHNLALGAEAKRVLAALRAAGLVAAPMKGVALFAEGIIEDLGARPTGDFDLVTRRSERAAVLGTLGELGYEARHEVASWKHLPALWRRDLSIEVHEIAYWSAASRAVFGADHLDCPHRPTRLGRLCALQIHHLVLGSPPDAGLVVRTLADVDGFLQLAAREPEVRTALARAAREGGVDRALAGCDAILAEARKAQPVLDLGATAADSDALLRPLRHPPGDTRTEMLAHALRILPVQPWEVTREMLSLLLFPAPELLGARLGRALGSGGVSWARARRPFELVARVARALPTALRNRPGRRAPKG